VTLELALVTALASLALGYPLAYYLARIDRPVLRNVLLITIVSSLWITYVIRAYAWQVILASRGILSSLGVATGVLETHQAFYPGYWGLVVGMVYVFLPFMVLSLYSSIRNLDGELLEASKNLGAGPLRTFRKVTLPLTKNGIASGTSLVFILALGSYVLPRLLGTPAQRTLPVLIEQQVMSESNYPFGAAMSIMLILVMLLFLWAIVRIANVSAANIGAGDALSDDDEPAVSASSGLSSVRGLLGSASAAVGLTAVYDRVTSTLSDVVASVDSGTRESVIGATFRAYVAAVMVFIGAPLAIIVAVSFTPEEFLTFPPGGFSMRWYVEFFTNPAWVRSLVNSLTIAAGGAARDVHRRYSGVHARPLRLQVRRAHRDVRRDADSRSAGHHRRRVPRVLPPDRTHGVAGRHRRRTRHLLRAATVHPHHAGAGRTRPDVRGGRDEPRRVAGANHPHRHVPAAAGERGLRRAVRVHPLAERVHHRVAAVAVPGEDHPDPDLQPAALLVPADHRGGEHGVHPAHRRRDDRYRPALRGSGSDRHARRRPGRRRADGAGVRCGRRANRQTTVEAVREHADADLVVLPELATSGYVFESHEEVDDVAEPADGPTADAWSSVAAETDTWVVGGFPEADGEDRYNSSLVVSPDGVEGTYWKVHRWNEEKKWFEAGDDLPVFDTPFGRLAVQICNDLWFPEQSITQAQSGVDIVAVPTNWVPEPADRPAGWSMGVHHAVANANSTRLFFACADRAGTERGVTFQGQSVVVDPDGVPVAGPLPDAGSHSAAVDCDLTRAREKALTPHDDVLADRRPDVYDAN